MSSLHREQRGENLVAKKMNIFINCLLLFIIIHPIYPQQSTSDDFPGRIEQAWKSNRKNLKKLYQQWGDTCHEQGRKKQALRAWLSILDISNRDWPIYVYLAKHLYGKKYSREAARVLGTTLQLSLTANQYLRGADLALKWQNDQLAERFLGEILGRHWTNENQVLPTTMTKLLQIYKNRRRDYLVKGKEQQAAKLAKKIAQLTRGIRPLDIKIVLTWNTATDIDLWVTNPQLKRCAYNNKITLSGEKLHNDDTNGHGPETFTVLKAKPGRYKVQVHYYNGTGIAESRAWV